MAEFSARRIVALVAIVAAVVGGAVAAAVAAVSSSGAGGHASSSSGSGSLATAPVVRTTLANTVQVGGSIGYAGSYAITARSGPAATYTWLPQTGDVIKEDNRLYSLDNEPVPLLYGAIPAYRSFSLGMSDGADVHQLTRDLIALGFGAGLARSNSFSSATAAAVERWQQALGLPVTGKIPLGQVVFEPGPIRITSV